MPICRPPRPPAHAGFSLLEILVVLVLTSLISSLLMQGLAQIFQLRTRFGQHLEQLQVGAMREHWFRASVAGLLPEYAPEVPEVLFQAEPPPAFLGEARRLSGLSLAGPDAESGTLSRCAWEVETLRQEQVLRYRSAAGTDWEVLRWGGTDGGFQYQDQAGDWHDAWPPPAETGEAPPQLPEAVRLNAAWEGRPLSWLVRVDGYKYTPVEYRFMGM